MTAPRPAAAQSIHPTLRDRLIRATVYIETNLELAARDWAALGPAAADAIQRRPSLQSSGSGFLISAGGYLITNAHVVGGVTYQVRADGRGGLRMQPVDPSTRRVAIDPDNPTRPFTVSFNAGSVKVVVRSGRRDEQTFWPSIIKTDIKADLALLKISADAPFDYLAINDSDAIESGRRVIMVGFPGGRATDIAPFLNAGPGDDLMRRNPRPSLNAGMVTAVRQYGRDRRYQLDIRANHGNSGGPITDLKGHVVAVLYAGIDTMESIHYAIPIAEVHSLLGADLRRSMALAPAGSDENQSYDAFVNSGTFSLGKTNP